MTRWLRSLLASPATEETGMALVGALVLLALGGIVIGPMLAAVDTGLASVTADLDKMQEYYAADAGVRDGLWQVLYKGLDVTEGTPVDLAGFAANSKAVSVQIAKTSEVTAEIYTTAAYSITSVAGSTVIEASVAVVSTWFTDGGLPIVGGDFVLEQGDDDWEDSVYVDGDVILDDHAEIEMDDGGDLYVYAGGDIAMADHAEIETEHGGGDIYLYAGGTIDIGASDGHEAQVRAHDGAVHIYAELDITLGRGSDIRAEGGDIRISAGRNMTLDEDARIRAGEHGGDVCINVAGDLVVGDGARIEADRHYAICICVGGDVTLNAGREIEGDFYVGGALTIGAGDTVTGDVYSDNPILGSGTHNGSTYPYQDCPCCPAAAVGSDIVSWEIR